MTKAKKAISVVLAVVMIAGLFAFGAFAADQNATIAVSASETQVEVGATVTVTVAATTDYYAAAASVPVYYDTAAFDLVPGSVTPSADLYGAGYTDTAINTTEAGCVTVAFIPKAGGTAQQLNNTTLFTFRLTAKANAQASPIATKADDQKTATNIGGKLYLGAYSTTDVSTATVTAVGQEFTLTNTAVTIGSAAAPELVVTEGTTGYIDEARKYVYGVAIGDEATNYFEATNGGTIEMVANDAGVTNGTGALLQLKGADGAVIDTYTLIIFGDVDGTGAVDATDSFRIMQYVAAPIANALNDVQSFAADVNATTEVDATDSFRIMQYVAAPIANALPVNPYAA
jgi:hypothetical protein